MKMSKNPSIIYVIHLYLYMSIYRRLIVIGKYLNGKFIAGKLVRFIGSKNKWENATIIPIQRHQIDI